MGQIRVSVNGRYFVDEDGHPFFWLGDTQWELFCALPPDDARQILERRKRQGFNVFQVMITGVGDGSKPNAAGQQPWHDGDPASPNEAYFENMDRVVDAAGELDVILVPGVFHQLQRDKITTANARAYARWIAERYADVPHLIWVMYPEAKQQFVPVLRELAAGLREGDGGAHMITVHPDPSPTSSSFIHEEEWLDFNCIQTCVDYELVRKMVTDDYSRTPPKPVIMAEGGYEGLEFGKMQTALEIRKQAYWSYLAGGYHTYGHNDSWTKVDTWRTWLDSPGARSLSVCKDVLTGLDKWWDLIPDQSFFVEGEGEGLTLNVAARSASGAWALFYLSSATSMSIKMRGIVKGATAKASWIDPTTGTGDEIGGLPARGVRSFSTPEGWHDALLLIERQGARV